MIIGFFSQAWLILLLDIFPIFSQQTCINHLGVTPALMRLTLSPAFLHPHEREHRIKKSGDWEDREAGAKQRRREVILCPKGLLSVCLNQEVRMWWQQRQRRGMPSLRVCLCEPCWAEVSYMWRSQLEQRWCSKSLECRGQVCCDMFCAFLWMCRWMCVPYRIVARV